MSDFTPIPGVWYVDRSYIDADRDIWYLYAPHRPRTDEATYPWWSNDTMEWEKEAPVDRLEVLHNPHPPTRTEWGVKWSSVGWLPKDCREDAEDEARILLDAEGFGFRQVTETEWVEVDDA